MADIEDIIIPKGFYKRGAVWWIYSSVSGSRIRISTKCRKLEDAILWAESRPHLFAKPHPEAAFKNPFHSESFIFTTKWKNETLSRINGRIPKGLDKMTISDMDSIIERANGKCEVTGIPFNDTSIPGAARKPFIPSFDRVDCSTHYSRNNCRLVCLSVNIALNQWGDRVFDVIALGRCTRRLAMQM